MKKKKMSKKQIILLGAFCFLSFYQVSAQEQTKYTHYSHIQSAFPGVEGFGSTTTGGRGGNIIHVTTLEDSMEVGTLRWALSQSGKRVIVFDVGGYIDLTSNLQIAHGDLSILGQSAPGDGITIRNASLVFKEGVENVIIRFIRSRYGNVKVEGDAIDGRYLKNIVVDHCSFSWSVDECASLYASNYISFQWNIVSESLNNSGHIKGNHGYGGNWGGVNTSFHHNLLAHHNGRNPRIDGILDKMASNRSIPELDGFCEITNNVIYNYGAAPYGAEGRNVQLIHNYFAPGPKTLVSRAERFIFYTSGKRRLFDEDLTNILSDYEAQFRAGTLDPKFIVSGKVVKPVGKVYVEGNYVFGKEDITADNALGVRHEAPHLASEILVKKAFSDSRSSIATDSAEIAYEKVLRGAGMSRSRDPVDARVIESVKNRTGEIIDVVEDVGGYPLLNAGTPFIDTDRDGMSDSWELANGLDPKNPKDAWEIFADAKGLYPKVKGLYTNFDVFMYSLVKDIEGCDI